MTEINLWVEGSYLKHFADFFDTKGFIETWFLTAIINNNILSFIYNHDTKKYKITVINAISNPREFLPQHYYFPLTLDKLSDNANLVEIPNY